MPAANAGISNLSSLMFPAIVVVMFYFFAIRPQKKRQKEVQEMRENLKVGDRVITIGGIRGRIAKIKEETLTIEVGSDKTKLDITRWAVGSRVVEDNEAGNN